MPKCNTVLYTASDLYEPEIELNSPGNCNFRPFLRTLKPKGFWLINYNKASLIRTPKDRRDLYSLS